MLDRRLQILLDERRFRRIEAAARERKTSVAQIVREAIDKAFPDDAGRKRAAGRAILAADPMPLPETVEKLKAEIREAHERGL